MFADQALANIIERAEARLMRDAVLGAQRHRLSEDAFALELGGGVASFLRASSPMNKVIGAGMFAALDDDELEEMESRYREKGEPVRIELATLAVPDTAQRLTERKYRLLGFENVLGRALNDDITPEVAGVRIVKIDDESLPEWQEVVTEGFASPDETGVPVDTFTRDTIASAVADSLRTPGYDRYLAFVDDVVAGAASMRIDGTIALFTGAATLRESRRRGAQAALFRTRLRDAHRRGATLAVITTGVGTQSQANAMKGGFNLLYARSVLVLSSRKS